MKKFFLSFASFILLTLTPYPVLSLEPGDLAKDFALRDKNGDIVTFSSLKEGAQVTVLEFISIYCDVCKKKVPQLNKLLAKYDPGKVKIIAVALANAQPEVDAETSRWGIHYPLLPDPDKITLHLYGIHNVPHLYVIDGSGVIRYSSNADNMLEIETLIDSLLQGTVSQCRPGDMASEIVLPDNDGKTIQVNFSKTNAPAVLAFFNSDNRQNRRQAQFLNDLREQTEKNPFLVYAIVSEPFDGDDEKVIKILGKNIPTLKDNGRKTFSLYCVESPPEIVIISPSGRIMKRNAPQDSAQLLKLLARPSVIEPTNNQERIMDALRRAMPDAQSIKPMTVGDTLIYVGTFADRTKGYARVVTKDILCEVCTDISFVQVIDQEGNYRAFELIQPFESYGKTIDASPFLRQFIGKSYHQPFVANANADTISGATKSCLKFIEALNENEHIFSQFLDDPSFDATFRRSVCFLEQSELELAMILYNRDHREPLRDIKDLAPYLPDKTLPVCPSGGTYMITIFNDIPRVICTVHGLDPQASMIH